MAAAVLTAGHIQRPGSRDREGRHPDRRGHGAHGGGSSPQLPNVRVAERSSRFRQSSTSLKKKKLQNAKADK